MKTSQKAVLVAMLTTIGFNSCKITESEIYINTHLSEEKAEIKANMLQTSKVHSYRGNVSKLFDFFVNHTFTENSKKEQTKKSLDSLTGNLITGYTTKNNKKISINEKAGELQYQVVYQIKNTAKNPSIDMKFILKEKNQITGFELYNLTPILTPRISRYLKTNNENKAKTSWTTPITYEERINARAEMENAMMKVLKAEGYE